MKINNYIKWDEIWDKEICLQTSIDCLEDDEINTKIIGIIQQFMDDNEVGLISSECEMYSNKLLFFFGESGGENESDTQGWSRDYTFIVNADFMIIEAYYSQG